MDDLLFFDIEVFKEDALVIFMDINKTVVQRFHNNFVGLYDLIKDKTLVSYNGYYYDDHILHEMLDLKPPRLLKDKNDRIIGGETMRIKHYKYKSLDAFQQIDVSMPSLKKIEGNSGKMILESSVPFDIDRALTEEELKETIKYCEYDIEMLIDVYKERVKSYFEPKKSIVDMLGNENAARWNTTTLSANVLTKKPLVKWSDIRVPDELLDIVPHSVVELWQTKEKGHVTINEFDNEITFGFGGLHGHNTTKKKFKNVKLLDVTSLYPSIIINHKILGTATEIYKGILEERIRIKHTDPERQAALKLILNSVYGLLKSKHSLLFNPKASTTVCAIGQCVLYDLAKRLDATCEIVQLNTDGVAFIPLNDDYKRVWKEWEADHNLTLEEDEFETFIQRDVNNYIAVTPSGKIKVKGGDVNRYHGDALFKNNNARILDIAIVDHLVYRKDILNTIQENRDKPHLYQYILQAGGTYAGTVDQTDKKHNKINRVFAAKEGDFVLFKKRHDGGLVRFADTPNKMYLWNDDCSKLENFKEIMDTDHYYQIITKKLERWT